MNYIKLVVRLLLALTVVGTLVFYIGCSKDEPVAPLDNESGEVQGIATPLFPDNIPDTPPVPESEIAEITFSETWLSENNKSDSPESFNITFPTKWLDESPKLAKQGEAVVKLRVPKDMIEFIDENPEQDIVEISLDREWFYPNEKRDEINITDEIQGSINVLNKSRATTAAFYAERDWFNKKSDDITEMYGYIYKKTCSNDGEEFTNYDETEIYLNQNEECAEIVNGFTGNANGTITRKVHWVLYDNDFGNCQWLLSMTPKTFDATIRFWLKIKSSDESYYFQIYDYESKKYYSTTYDDSDNFSSHINWVTGSTELYCDFNKNKDFSLKSRIRNYRAKKDGTWKNLVDCFSYHSGNYEDYVSNIWQTSSTSIYSNHTASNDPDL